MEKSEANPPSEQGDPEQEQLSLFKDSLSEPRFRIRLDDLVNAAIRATLLQTTGEKFTLSDGRVTGEEFVMRLKEYEGVIRPLQARAVLMGKWATFEQRLTLTNMLARMCDNCSDTNGNNGLWLSLRWYPVSLLMYSAGIAALSAENYPAFVAVHTKRIMARTRRVGRTSVSIVVPVIDAMAEVAETNAWRCVEEYRKNRTPESDHLFKNLRPVLDDLLFLGAGYEHLFDRYEVLRTLIYADLTEVGWAPIGRFGWKYAGGGDNPYKDLRTEADQQQDAWGPIQAGLFRGSYARFEETAMKLEKDMLSKLNWY